VYQDLGKGSPGSTVIVDALADGAGCARDIPYLQRLGVNTILVYAVDTNGDHSACLQQLATAGIYVLAQLNGKPKNVDQNIGYRPASWQYTLANRFMTIIDEFQAYPNVLGFMVAHGLEESTLGLSAMGFVKAAVRDMKSYMKIKGYRNIPVGYGGDDFDSRSIGDYLNCGDRNSSIDFISIDRGDFDDFNNTINLKFVGQLTRDYRDFSIPMFIDAYAADPKVQPYPFNEVQVIYSPNTTQVISGAFEYGWFHNYDDPGKSTIKLDTHFLNLCRFGRNKWKHNRTTAKLYIFPE
jgi:hypothetical protein